MVDWKDQGIIVGMKSLGEKDTVVHILTCHYGCHRGVLKNKNSKTNQSLQVGTIASCQWKARLPEHMGNWTLEAEKSYLAEIFSDPQKLLALTTIGQFVSQLLPERHPYPELFKLLKQFLENLVIGEEWRKIYVLFEFHLLQEMGFGLKLKSCAVTNTKENLKYVSPKTGCAVTESIGLPYHDKLLYLPDFLIDEVYPAHRKEILEGLDLTGYFLIKHFPEQKYANLFQMRQRFIENL